MNDFRLLPISIDDIEILDLTEYNNLSKESRQLLIRDSDRGLCNGKLMKRYIKKL